MFSDLAEAEVAHTGATVALIPSEVDAERLAVDGGEDPAELHLTLAYLGDAVDIDAATRQDIIDSISAAVNGMPVVEAEAFSVAAFNPLGGERDPCLVYGISGDLVDAAHTLVAESVWSASPKQHAPFCAHVTAAYTDDLGRLAELAKRVGPVRFDRLRIAFAGQALDIPLIEDDFDDAEDPDEALALAEADGDRNALKRYWLRKGLRRWATKKHPWSTLYRLLKKHLSAERAKRVTSAWYRDHFGHMPNQKRKAKESASLAEAGRDDAYNAAATGLIVAWPVIAAPLVDQLASDAATGPRASLAPAQASLDAVAAGLVPRLEPVAAAAAAATVADAAAQGATVGQVAPAADRLAELAAVTTAMIAASLTATAVEAALTAPAEVAEAVRTALVAAGVAHRGQVATRLRAALTGAEADGRRAVFEAHPPEHYEATEQRDGETCSVCREADGRRYPTLADALRDYPGWGGNRACAGTAARCRGFVRGVWRRPVAESAATGSVEMLLIEAGSFHLAE